MKPVLFNGYRCRPLLQKYIDGTPRLDLIDYDTGEPLYVVTVNIPEHLLPEGGWVHVKEWSGNEGIADVLEDAGILNATLITTPVNHVEARICRLNFYEIEKYRYIQEEENELEKQKQEWWSQQNDDEEYLREQGEIE